MAKKLSDVPAAQLNRIDADDPFDGVEVLELKGADLPLADFPLFRVPRRKFTLTMYRPCCTF